MSINLQGKVSEEAVATAIRTLRDKGFIINFRSDLVHSILSAILQETPPDRVFISKEDATLYLNATLAYSRNSRRDVNPQRAVVSLKAASEMERLHKDGTLSEALKILEEKLEE
uniref:Uncharacterized protein n=1 Tax=viral metagenome TaxID=1070528 RepID=A0A6M3JPA8_9ZZZZ